MLLLPKNINKSRVIIIGNGPSMLKINMNSFKKDITIGVNAVLLSGFEPNFICISDHTILKRNPISQVFSSRFSKYILREDLWRRFQKQILKYVSITQIHTLRLIDHDFMSPDVTSFDPSFRQFNVSYSVMIDLAIPLALYLGSKQILIMGIDHQNYRHHSYDSLLKKIPKNLPNPQKIKDFDDQKQSDNLSLRYSKVLTILQTQGIEIINVGLDSLLKVFPTGQLLDYFPPLTIKHISCQNDSIDNKFILLPYQQSFNLFQIKKQDNKVYLQHASSQYHLVKGHNGQLILINNHQREKSDYQNIESLHLVSDRNTKYTVTLRSYQNPIYYISSSTTTINLTPLRMLITNNLNYQLPLISHYQSTITIIPELGEFVWCADLVHQDWIRLAPINKPNYYLRHCHGKLVINKYECTKIFEEDSLFLPEKIEQEEQEQEQEQGSEFNKKPIQYYFKSFNKTGFHIEQYHRKWKISKQGKTALISNIISY